MNALMLTFTLTHSLNEHFTRTAQRITWHCNAIGTVHTWFFNVTGKVFLVSTVHLYK